MCFFYSFIEKKRLDTCTCGKFWYSVIHIMKNKCVFQLQLLRQLQSGRRYFHNGLYGRSLTQIGDCSNLCFTHNKDTDQRSISTKCLYSSASRLIRTSDPCRRHLYLSSKKKYPRKDAFQKSYVTLECDAISSSRHSSHCVNSNSENKGKNQNQQSALYVSHSDQFNTTTVLADLNLEARFQNMNKLHENIIARGMDLNVYELYSKYKELQDLRYQLKKIELKRKQVADVIAKLTPGSEEFEEQKSRARRLKLELKPVTEIYNEMEDVVSLEALKLPTDLHLSTPEESTIIEEVGNKPDFTFTPKDHVRLGEKTHSIIFSTISPGAHYLQGKLSLLQYRMEVYLDGLLQKAGMTSFVCPDAVKSVVVEGSGSDIKDPKMVFTMRKKTKEIQEELDHGLQKLDNTYHLMGVSAAAFNAYLTRCNIAENGLPLKYYSIGSMYTPRPLHICHRYPSLLASPQPTVAELFGGTRNSEEMELVFEEYVNIMKEFYKSLDLPVRYVQAGTSCLKAMEAARLDTEIWMPSLANYVKVGFVSMWNDYASRRLMMKYSAKAGDQRNKNYFYTVHSTLINMPVFIAALMENTQTKAGHFELPEPLLERLGL